MVLFFLSAPFLSGSPSLAFHSRQVKRGKDLKKKKESKIEIDLAYKQRKHISMDFINKQTRPLSVARRSSRKSNTSHSISAMMGRHATPKSFYISFVSFGVFNRNRAVQPNALHIISINFHNEIERRMLWRTVRRRNSITRFRSMKNPNSLRNNTPATVCSIRINIAALGLLPSIAFDVWWLDGWMVVSTMQSLVAFTRLDRNRIKMSHQKSRKHEFPLLECH